MGHGGRVGGAGDGGASPASGRRAQSPHAPSEGPPPRTAETGAAIRAFDIFKIGFGPSSPRTFGPVVACRRCLKELRAADQFDRTDRVTVTLYGSLGATGKGHFTDVAVVLGLEGNNPPTTAGDTVLPKTGRVREEKNLQLGGTKRIPFDWDKDIVWKGEQTLAKHPNGIEFAAPDAAGE